MPPQTNRAKATAPALWRRSLVRPGPVADFGGVLALGAGVGPGFGALVLHQLAYVTGPRGEARDSVDGGDHQMEAVQVVEHDHVERGGGRALFLVAADVDVVVAIAAVGQAMDEPRVAVIGEDDRLVRGEERVELLVRHAVRMFGLGLQTHQVDHVYYADLDVRQVLAHQVDGGQGLQCRDVAAAGHDDIRLAALIVAGPVPDSDAAGAVQDRLLHGQPVGRGLLAGHDDVDVVAAPQAVVRDRQHRVGVRRQIDSDDLGLLVDDDIDKARVLMGEAVVVLTPDQR